VGVSAPGRWLHEVWEQLTARGFVIDEPADPVTWHRFFRNLRGAQCEMDLMVTGALVWEYLPQGATSPRQAARLVLALLRGTGPSGFGLPPGRYPGLPLAGAAGRMLAACGMTVALADVRYGDDVCAEVMVTSPAEPARGHVRISDEGTVRWECWAPGSVGGGLAAPGIARAIATALAGHTIIGPSGTAGSRSGETAAR
jgi:hypothetical protein